ncbi:hypothetical protein HHI36_005091, partial [Cryptolaemus montrouzieri]
LHRTMFSALNYFFIIIIKIPKPLLAGISSKNGALHESESFLLTHSRHESGEILLLEKQGRTSQQHRMQDGADNNSAASNSPSPTPHCPAPCSLPRPPRNVQRSGLPWRLGEYNRLPDNEIQRKKFDGDLLSSNASSRRNSPARSMIPPPRKLGKYGRLVESGGSSSSQKTINENS